MHQKNHYIGYKGCIRMQKESFFIYVLACCQLIGIMQLNTDLFYALLGQGDVLRRDGHSRHGTHVQSE